MTTGRSRRRAAETDLELRREAKRWKECMWCGEKSRFQTPEGPLDPCLNDQCRSRTHSLQYS